MRQINQSIHPYPSIHHPIKLGALFYPPKKFRCPLLKFFSLLPPVATLRPKRGGGGPGIDRPGSNHVEHPTRHTYRSRV
jgi:hypothetical protein